MKNRFSGFDIVCTIAELQKHVGMRVNNVYDIDNRTYLIRLQRYEEKCVLLLESGNRFHSTGFEWPKNVAPSGFSMKLRKHINNKRLECLEQLGNDRIVHLQFGTGEAAYHVILELYDKGNIILTDFEYTIINILRPRTESEDVKFYVREKYQIERVQTRKIDEDAIREVLQNAKEGDQLKKLLVAKLPYGPALIEHVLLNQGFTNATKVGSKFSIDDNISKLMNAITEAEELFSIAKKTAFKGYIIQKKEHRHSKINKNEEESYFLSNQEFHPYLFKQFSNQPYLEFDTFNMAVDEFFSSLESQKLELKTLQQEREAVKKLENVKKDHDQRLIALEKDQEIDKKKAELITRNLTLVESAIVAIQTALANQVSWPDLEDLVKDAASKEDEIAKHVKKLKLETNQITLYLTDPYVDSDNEENDNDCLPPMLVDVDLSLSAFSNARKYYDMKRSAAKKQQKTIESQTKALKSAEKKTKQTLKDVQTTASINRSRKVYWFEKFFWFISSENYLIIGGRDQKQNELIVKRYMKNNDIYVHADVHGASSIVIKNPTGQPVPPKTLNEAGTMAICYSVAWDAKVVTNAYWVWGEQVSKTAPTGEYLTTGSFMIRGKKNFLPLSQLVLGFSFLFKLDDSCVEKHKGERKVTTEEQIIVEKDTEDVVISDDENNESQEDSKKVELKDIVEENTSEEYSDNKLGETGEKDVKENEKESPGQEENEEERQENIEEGLVEGTEGSDTKTSFPDTQVKIQHLGGTRINIITENSTKLEENNVNKDVSVGGKSRKSSTSSTKQKTHPQKSENSEITNNKQQQQQPPKRGQKSKLKKIKEKYKDQDEEERKLRMEILQSAGSGKEAKKNKKNKGQNFNTKPKPTVQIRTPKIITQKQLNDDGTEEIEEVTFQTELDMIDTLSGIPLPDDELLFAVPVVAPYNTLSNYKFKVKLTPGTAKRGKAARTAVSIFLRDKAITPRERDLLKAVKDEQLAINIPGKVKLSAPKLQVLKK